MTSEYVAFRPARLQWLQAAWNRARLSIATLWLVSLILHLVAVTPFLRHPIALDDMFQYDMLARSLQAGEGFRWYSAEDVEVLRPYLSQFVELDGLEFPENGLRTAHRAPGYPVLLSCAYRFASPEDRFAAARIVQAFIISLLAPLVALLAVRMGLGRRTALVAGYCMALYPILLGYPIALASENLYIPLVSISLLLVLWAGQRKGWLPAALAGLVLGMAMLTRSLVAPFTLLAGLWMLRCSRAGGRGAATMLAVAFLLCVPWCVRNSQVMGQPSFVENGLYYNMFIGYHPSGNGCFVSQIAVLPLTILNDGERERYCREAALRFVQADPIEAVRRVLPRTVELLGPEDREVIYLYSNGYLGYVPQPWSTVGYLLLVIPWFSTVTMAVLGMWGARDRSAVWLVLALLLGYGAPPLLILAEPRFHLALVPALMPFAAYGWTERGRLVALLRGPSQQRPSGAWPVALSLGILIMLWVYGLANDWGRLVTLLGPEGHTLGLTY